ncbi:hypothetical protein ACFLWU_01100 [Chloroflexota bacterium]
MILHTASEIISLARELEKSSAEYYKILSQKFTDDQAVFIAFSEENRKNVIHVERTYYGVISDALEGGFAFNLEADYYGLATKLAENAVYSEALDNAIKNETIIAKFYSDAAEQSQSLMADIPRVFKLLARKRDERKLKLESLLKEKG